MSIKELNTKKRNKLIKIILSYIFIVNTWIGIFQQCLFLPLYNDSNNENKINNKNQ